MPTPQKLSLPRKLSNLSPTEIANLLSPIESFEGPIDVTVMIPTDRLHKELGRRGPVLVLLGDYHSGDKKCVKICDPDAGCYSLYRPSTFLHFIDTLAKKHLISADIFLEFWVPEGARVAFSKGEAHFSSESDSSLFEAVLESAPCTSHAANFCPFPHVRTHLSDTRKIDLNSKYNGEAIFSTLHMMTESSCRCKHSFIAQSALLVYCSASFCFFNLYYESDSWGCNECNVRYPCNTRNM